MKKIIPSILLFMVLSCSTDEQTARIADVQIKEKLILKKLDSQGNIHSLIITGKGHLNGIAEIALVLDGKQYKTEHLFGEVEFVWDGDWYSDVATIEYLPSTVERGHLTVEYRFKDI
jgi:hypothetical protein